MNWEKPRVTVMLEEQLEITMLPNKAKRGPDYWKVTANIGTKEGQRVIITRRSMHKRKALEAAYDAIRLCMKWDTLTYDYAKQHELAEMQANERTAYSPKMDERCDPLPPKKWKWWNWFYNPENK